jgi:hypothetical protein
MNERRLRDGFMEIASAAGCVERAGVRVLRLSFASKGSGVKCPSNPARLGDRDDKLVLAASGLELLTLAR